MFYVHPYLGRWPNLTNIFQMGWNHQPEIEERDLQHQPLSIDRFYRWNKTPLWVSHSCWSCSSWTFPKKAVDSDDLGISLKIWLLPRHNVREWFDSVPRSMFIPQLFWGITVEATVDTVLRRRHLLWDGNCWMFFKSLKVKQPMYQWDLKPKTRVPRAFLCRCFLKQPSIDPLVLSREKLVGVDHQFVELFQPESGSMMTFPWAPSIQEWPNGEICLDQIQHKIQISYSL